MPPRRSTRSACRTRPRSSRPIARPSGCTTMPSRPRRAVSRLIIAGAGGAAHLPGMTASMTAFPCSACRSKARRSRASIACCRSSRCPPGCRSARSPSARPAPSTRPARGGHPGHRRRGARPSGSTPGATPNRRGGRNARMIVPPGSTIGIVGGGQLGRMLGDRRRAARLSNATSSIRTSAAGGRRRGATSLVRLSTTGRARRVRRRGRRRHLRIREFAGRSRWPRSATSFAPARARSRSPRTAPRKRLHRAIAARASRRGARSPALADVDRRGREARPAAGAQDPPLRL